MYFLLEVPHPVWEWKGWNYVKDNAIEDKEEHRKYIN